MWTRKLDGSNTKLLREINKAGDINDFLVGTREGWLYAHGDRILRKDHGILDALFSSGGLMRESIVRMCQRWPSRTIAIYGEVYGGKNDVRYSAKYGDKTLFTPFDVVVHTEGTPEWILPEGGVEVVHSEAFTPRTSEELADTMGEVVGLTGAGTGSGYLEGYVLRSAERPWVKAKVRFESYWKQPAAKRHFGHS